MNHLIELMGANGYPVRVNPDMIIIVDQAVAMDTATGKTTVLPGLTGVMGFNTSFTVKHTVEKAIALFGNLLLTFEQGEAIVGVNPLWISGIQQNIKDGAPILHQTVLSLPILNIVVDGNCGEITEQINWWWGTREIAAEPAAPAGD